MSISHWLDQHGTVEEFDVIIVGAGIAGLSTAYWLEKKVPNIKIAIVERNRFGFGASGRNAGFVTCGSTEHFMKLRDAFGIEKAVEIWKFSEENHRLLSEEILQGDREAFDYRRTGSCTVAPSEERWAQYQVAARQMRDHKIDVSEIGEQELHRDYGLLGGLLGGFLGAIQYAGDGYIHPIKLLTHIRSRLKAKLYEGREVFSIQPDQSDKKGKQVVRTDLGTLRSEKVVLTVNAYLPMIFKEFASLVVPGRGQILVTEPLPPLVKGPCYLTKHLCYFRQLPTGHLLVGGFRNLATEVENTYTDQTTPLIQEALLQFVRDHFKNGREARVAYRWAGIMGFTPDGQQLLGEIAGRKGVYVLAGCSGHGMGLNFHAAKVLTDCVLAHRNEMIPSHLRVERFIVSQ